MFKLEMTATNAQQRFPEAREHDNYLSVGEPKLIALSHSNQTITNNIRFQPKNSINNARNGCINKVKVFALASYHLCFSSRSEMARLKAWFGSGMVWKRCGYKVMKVSGSYKVLKAMEYQRVTRQSVAFVAP